MSLPKNGNLYWGIRILRNKKPRTLYVYADQIRIQDGDLVLFGHWNGKEPSTCVLRSLARGTWLDVFAASCLDGNEISEQHDIDDKTGEDARTGMD